MIDQLRLYSLSEIEPTVTVRTKPQWFRDSHAQTSKWFSFCRLEVKRLEPLKRFERRGAIERLERLEPMFSEFLFTCYKRSLPVIMWDVFECLTGLSEREKGWDYE